MNKHLILTALLLFSAANAAHAICQLNIRGEEICEDKEALVMVEQASEEKTENAPAKIHKIGMVTSIDYPRVSVQTADKKERVSIDQVVASQECLDDKKVCAGEKVKLAKECAKEDKIDFIAKSVYANGMIKIQIKGILPIVQKTHTYLIPSSCVEEVKQTN